MADHKSIPVGQHPDDEFYDMTHPNQGIALIFNNQIFDNPLLNERIGTQKDRDSMEQLMNKFGFHVQIYQDYTVREIRDALYVVSKMDHKDNNCLVVAVMTHGRCSGRLSAKDDEYHTDMLITAFDGLHCPSLRGKPKLFFIQACRGDQLDDGVKLLHTDAGRSDQKHVYTIPTTCDVLVMYATVEGYSAWRDTVNGSWFVQTLVKKLEEHRDRRDLMSILTVVNKEVAVGFESSSPRKDYSKKKAMCSIVSMLTRELSFKISKKNR